mgnify:CR=1 FL=1
MLTTALYITLTTQIALPKATQVTHTKPANKLIIHLQELVPKQEKLEENLKAHYQETYQTLISALNYKEKGTIFQYLPSVSYNFIKLSPTITYHANKITASINRQRAKKAKIQSIQEKIQIALQDALKKLNKNYANLKAEIKLYNQTVKIYQLKKELFKIKKEQYNNLEITPTAFIKSQIKIKTEKLKLNKQYTNIIKHKNHILELAKANYEKEEP